nr:MAG TPA: hypothetical protein [Caudoviricetes sp.]
MHEPLRFLIWFYLLSLLFTSFLFAIHYESVNILSIHFESVNTNFIQNESIILYLIMLYLF